MSARKIKIKSFSDDRGSLTVGEFPATLPFEPVRFFLVKDVPSNQPRGNHAHKTNHQLLFCLSGSLKIEVFDGREWSIFELSPNEEGLYIPPLNWGIQKDFDPGTILLVLASEPYSEDEYIYTLEEFAEFAGNF